MSERRYEMPSRLVRLALGDPGAFVERRHDLGPEQDELEPLIFWQARALAAAGLLTTVAAPQPADNAQAGEPKPYLCGCPSDDPRPCPLHDSDSADNAHTESS